MDRLYRCVDLVVSGKVGAISESLYLFEHYNPAVSSYIISLLNHRNQAVRKEALMLLTKLKERSALDAVKELRRSGNSYLSGACMAYLNSVNEDDVAVPHLLNIMKTADGHEFLVAALKLGSIARAEDVPEIRKIYGRVDGEMKDAVRQALEKVISRNPSLEKEKDLILSYPVFPNEKEFNKILDKYIEYLAIRYSKNIYNSSSISDKVYGNVLGSLRIIRIRLYNERSNLQFYSSETKEKFEELEDLLVWAAEDIGKKKIIFSDDPKHVKGLDSLS